MIQEKLSKMPLTELRALRYELERQKIYMQSIQIDSVEVSPSSLLHDVEIAITNYIKQLWEQPS